MTEKSPMTLKKLILFPKSIKTSKQSKKLKEKENIVDVLAAGIVKLAAGQKVDRTELSQLQISDAPPLFSGHDQTQHRKSKKTDIRNRIKQQYFGAFGRFHVSENSSIYIRDSMQDILIQPLKHHVFFLLILIFFRR